MSSLTLSATGHGWRSRLASCHQLARSSTETVRRSGLTIQVRSWHSARRNNKRLRTKPASSSPLSVIEANGDGIRIFGSKVRQNNNIGTAFKKPSDLNPPPSSSSKNPGSSGIRPSVQQVIDRVTFTPPSTPPSPYNTPAVFLPQADPRRTLLAQAYLNANPYYRPDFTNPEKAPSAFESIAGQLKPKALPRPVRQPYAKTYHLSPEQVEEIRQLRLEDPWKNTTKTLAKKYGCTDLFVSMVAPLAPDSARLKWSVELQDAIKSSWGKRRRVASLERARRREAWTRDATI